MSGTATPFGYEVPGWLPGTRHYFTDDGKVLAVKVHVDPYEPGNELVAAAIAEVLGVINHAGDHTVVEMPTHVIECRPDGVAESLEPVHVSDGAVSHEEALAEMGYEVAQ